ncbi:MAG: HD domain-containing phosphohydrolase [Thermodesulfobacteriota bacterium]
MFASEAVFVDAMRTLAMVMDLDEGEKLNHAWRVGLLSLAVAREMGLSRPDLVYYAGLLHDVGAVGLSDHVIHHAQQGFRDPEARRHPERGAHILEPFLPFMGLDKMVADHHERFDGRGFPGGKRGDDISPAASVIHLADILDIGLRGKPLQDRQEKAIRLAGRQSGAAVGAAVAEAAASAIAKDRAWFEDLFEPEGPKTQAMAVHLAPPETARYTPRELMGQLLWLFSRVIDAKSPEVMGHSVRVAEIASRIARALGSDELSLWEVACAGLLHDVGIMGLPRSLFIQDRPPEPRERLRIARHAVYSMEIISHIRPVAHLALAAGSHHERYDGSGYPHRSRGEDTPLLGRLLAFADFYDRLTFPASATRHSHAEAMKRMREEKGKRLDPRLAEAAFEVLSGLEGREALQSPDVFKTLFGSGVSSWESDALGENRADPRFTKVSLLYQSFLMSAEPVLFADAEGRVMDANRALLSAMGTDLERIAGRKLEALGLSFAATGPGETEEHTLTSPDGAALQYLISTQLIRDTAGQTLGRILHMTDITARRQMEITLKEKNRALAELSRMKSDMLAITSHDMKSPLGGIIGYASMIKDLHDELSRDERLRFLDRIIASGRQLVRFVNDILDASRIESGSLELFFEPVDLDPILRELVDEHLAATQGRELTIRYRPPKEPRLVRADKARITQVLANLLSNAVKFSPDGGVVTIEYGFSADGSHVVSVADRGPGIAEKDLEKIFERYYQSGGKNGKGKPSHQGSGLGLYIVKNLSEGHGGRVAVRNRQGGGSLFTLTLPPAGPEEE